MGVDMEKKNTKEILLSLKCIHPSVTLSSEEGFIQIGEIVHQAADMIESLAYENEEAKKQIAYLDSLLREAFPIKP